MAAKKTNAVGDTFPSQFPADMAQRLIDYLLGRSTHTTRELLEAASQVVLYAIGQMVIGVESGKVAPLRNVDSVVGYSNKEKADILQAAIDQTKMDNLAVGFDWGVVWMIVRELIDRFLSGDNVT